MKYLVFAAALLISGAARAEQNTAGERALSAKLMREINEGISCNMGLMALQDDLAKAQVRIKELEAGAKAEPKQEVKP